MSKPSYGSIQLSPELDELFDLQSEVLIKKYYSIPEDNSMQETLARPALAFCNGDEALAQRIYEYAAKRWFMYASPVLSNAPAKGSTSKGLPISCFLTEVNDSLKQLMAHTTEIRWLSVKGGGVGGHWSKIRAVSDIAPGPLPFLRTIDADVTAYRQGITRRASYAAYLDISHPDIMKFINIRVPTGGDITSKCLNLHNAVNITDEFMSSVLEGKKWDLKCPHSGEVKETVDARELWQQLLTVRYRTGEPYITFIDTANKELPSSMIDKGLKIHGSNLCVHKDTYILTEQGQQKIGLLKDKKVTIWNGSEWSEVVVRQTGRNKKLLRVTLSDGTFLDCTPEHVFYIYNDNKEGDVVKKTAGSVDRGDMVTCINFNGLTESMLVIVDVTNLEGTHDTFCFTEPKKHMGVFNGILTGNCNEIYLPTSEDRTAVCCLSSVNLEKYDEWKDSSLIEDLITFLDNVLQHFIDYAPDELSKAKYSAMQERSLGLGAMGFHSFLQSKNIPWESMMAQVWNKKIFKLIKERAYKRTVELAGERGSCPDVIGVRNSHLLAIAPNSNSGVLCGTSASIEPLRSNCYSHMTRIGTHLVKNRYLEKLLESYNKNTDEIWLNIMNHEGSVAHLDFLTDEEKEIFKTAFELDQTWVIRHAADRQPFICQGQSVNLFFPEGADKCYVNSVHILAYKLGLKGLYYLKTKAPSKVDSVSKKVVREALVDHDECIACQG